MGVVVVREQEPLFLLLRTLESHNDDVNAQGFSTYICISIRNSLSVPVLKYVPRTQTVPYHFPSLGPNPSPSRHIVEGGFAAGSAHTGLCQYRDQRAAQSG